MKTLRYTNCHRSRLKRAVRKGGSSCVRRLMSIRGMKENKSYRHWHSEELQGKVGKCFFSDGNVRPYGFRGKIILTAFRYFSRKPCLTGSIYRSALVVQRAAKAQVFTIKLKEL